MKIVITGATGHLGTYVTHHLLSLGHDVVAASTSGSSPPLPFGEKAPSRAARAVRADISRDDAVDALAAELGPEVALVHLAAWHPPATASTSPADRARLIEVNALGTMRVYHAARKARARCVVYASTFEVYGDTHDNPITEKSRVAPLTDYGATKLSGEDHLYSLEHEEGIRGVSLRLPAVYGPGERTARALPNFLRAVARGERPTIAGDGLDQRDELHARDAALAISCAIDASASGIFNINDGHAHTIGEMARLALEVSGLGGDPTVVPREKPRRDYHMSIDLARSVLGYEPRVSLRDGMAEELRWLRED